MFQWKKLGLIFKPQKRYDWMCSHCQLPVSDHLYDDVYRIYFATRNESNISQIGFVDININNPTEILNVSETPVLKNGRLGHFDEYGVYPSSIVNHEGIKYMYYIGWVRGYKSPMFYASIGMAVSLDNGKTFQKHSNVPILDRSTYDPCLVTSPNVIINNNKWFMTYVSGIEWENVNNQLKSKYHIKIATSADGYNWIRKGKIAIDFKHKDETNIARPSVIQYGDKFLMWFSYVTKDDKYKIGFAHSNDLINWEREDEKSGINLSDSDFDNEMICYPNVFKHSEKYFMLYNGNNYGKSGFGLAIHS